MKKLIAFVLFSLLVASCGTLGREFPRCEYTFTDVPISIIMQVQAIPAADAGPCLNDLEPGWTYHHMQFQSDQVNFWLDSDRLGDRFVEVTMSPSCDPGSAAFRSHPNESISRFVEATEEPPPVDVVIVPIVASAYDYAAEVGVDLAGVFVRGRPLALHLDDGVDPANAMSEARSRGSFVIAIDDGGVRDRTVDVQAPDGGVDYDESIADAVSEIADEVEEGRYTATWFHLFEGACVTFEFDAAGPGVENVAAAVERTIGFADLEELKEEAAEGGFILDESELNS